MGAVVEEADDLEVRETLCDSYRIIYRYDGRRVLILTIWHGARPLDPRRILE